jgi:hypothetical protein
LCSEVPPPPPNTPALPPFSDAIAKKETTRQRLEAGLSVDPTCVTCHRLFDQPGYAFEEFDAVGVYRTTENGQPIDSRGQLTGTDVDGSFANATELENRLLGSKQLLTCVAKQVYRYATGRVESPEAAPTIAHLQACFTVDSPVTDLLLGIVSEPAFVLRSGPVGFTIDSVSGPLVPPSGNVATWTVVISAKTTGSAGVTVNLASSFPSRASVPAMIAIPPNSNSATFPVTMGDVGPATITASVVGSSQQGPFGYAINSVTVNPSTIVGIGNKSTVTATLDTAAPPGGFVVNLVTNDPTVVSVPSPTATIPEGSSTVQFPATAVGPGIAAIYVTLGVGGGPGQSITVTR